MEDLKTNVGQLKDHVSDYAKTYVDLVKAKATRGASNAQQLQLLVFLVLY
jgi:hypothetical protein